MVVASPRLRNALTLFSSRDCVVCHRVRLVLAAKGVTYDLVPVDPANPPFPTPMNFPFQFWAGSQSSILIRESEEGLRSRRTRQ